MCGAGNCLRQWKRQESTVISLINSKIWTLGGDLRYTMVSAVEADYTKGKISIFLACKERLTAS